jgi:hypothetical protein
MFSFGKLAPALTTSAFNAQSLDTNSGGGKRRKRRRKNRRRNRRRNRQTTN